MEPSGQIARLEGGLNISPRDDFDAEFRDGDNPEVVAGLRFEALRPDGWGLSVEASHIDVDEEPASPSRILARAEVQQGVLETFAVRRSGREDPLDLYVGLRLWRIDLVSQTRSLGTPTPVESRDEFWIDPVVGARFYKHTGERFAVRGQVDVGGFGIGSDISLSASAGFVHEVNRVFAIIAEYRVLSVQYSGTWSSDHFEYDTTIHGPRLGLGFSF